MYQGTVGNVMLLWQIVGGGVVKNVLRAQSGVVGEVG